MLVSIHLQLADCFVYPCIALRTCIYMYCISNIHACMYYIIGHTGEALSYDCVHQSLHILYDWPSHPVLCADQCLFSGV